jgi:hypothetical protein
MNNKQITEALVNLGFNEFVVRGDTYSGIEWIVEPSKKPTEKEVIDAVGSLLTEEEIQIARQVKRDSAITKLKALGLTEEEIGAII